VLRISLLLFSLVFTTLLAAQGAPLPVDDENYDYLRRLYLKYGYEGFTAPAADLDLRPASRGDLVRLAKTYAALYGDQMSQVEQYRLQGFFDDNNEWLSLPTFEQTDDADRAPFYLGDDFALQSEDSPLYRSSRKVVFNTFYETPAFMFSKNIDDFYLRINPVLDVRYGQLQDDEQAYFYNQRGIRLRAGFDDRIFLHFEILDYQLGAPDYVRDYFRRVGSLPGAGLVKDDVEIAALNLDKGYNYLNGSGYLSADITRHVGIRLGYGQHFIGQGERSLLLSDFSNNYPFLELNWRIWKFHYRNLFAQLTAGPQGVTNNQSTLDQKYMAAHYLSINIGKRLSLGLFETVIFSRDDGFDLSYLNPIILYRTVEGGLGSPDNVLIGLTSSYRIPFLRAEVYGQFILDEFVYDELFVQKRGWWANKWAYQIGGRAADLFGIDQLDVVAERNVARPYIFSHDGQSSYTHFAMPLAHPLGANFTENLVGVEYRPLPRLHLSGRAYLIEQGEGIDSTVVGENLNQSSNLREMTYGNEIGQGISYTNTIIQLRAGYEIRPNLWLEAEYFRRSKDSDRAARDLETTLVNVGVRWNVGRRREAF